MEAKWKYRVRYYTTGHKDHRHCDNSIAVLQRLRWKRTLRIVRYPPSVRTYHVHWMYHVHWSITVQAVSITCEVEGKWLHEEVIELLQSHFYNFLLSSHAGNPLLDSTMAQTQLTTQCCWWSESLAKCSFSQYMWSYLLEVAKTHHLNLPCLTTANTEIYQCKYAVIDYICAFLASVKSINTLTVCHEVKSLPGIS